MSSLSVSRLMMLTVLALALGLGVSMLVGSGTVLSLLTQATIYAVFALGVGLLLRQNGMVSFGHALYFGSAGYIVAIALQTHAMAAEWAILVAVLGLTLFGFVIGLVIVRVPGVAFGMLTLAVGQMAYLTASRSRGLTGGADGMSVEWPNTLFGVSSNLLFKPASLMLISWTVLVLLLLGLALGLRGRFGAITEAARDNEERARFIGIQTLVPRAAVYALSAGVTAVAGVLAALNTGFVSPEALHWSLSGVALMMVVVGGTRVLWGPALGAAIYFLAKDVLGDHAQHWMAIFGTALIVVIVFAPEGLSGLLNRLLGLKPSGGAGHAGSASAHH
jgi:branched-chain amino acid transport system permease protein